MLGRAKDSESVATLVGKLVEDGRDLAKAEIGDTIRISDIKLPKGAEATITDRDFVIATVKISSAALSEAADEAADAEAAPAEKTED